jgi:hypothetical protein
MSSRVRLLASLLVATAAHPSAGSNFADMPLQRVDFFRNYSQDNPSGVPNACVAPH